MSTKLKPAPLIPLPVHDVNTSREPEHREADPAKDAIQYKADGAFLNIQEQPRVTTDWDGADMIAALARLPVHHLISLNKMAAADAEHGKPGAAMHRDMLASAIERSTGFIFSAGVTGRFSGDRQPLSARPTESESREDKKEAGKMPRPMTIKPFRPDPDMKPAENAQPLETLSNTWLLAVHAVTRDSLDGFDRLPRARTPAENREKRELTAGLLALNGLIAARGIKLESAAPEGSRGGQDKPLIRRQGATR